MQFTDPAAQAVFEEYDAREHREKEVMGGIPRADFGARRDEFLLPVGAEAGNFLRALAVARKAKRVLELGTSYGYSTLFLADAARQTGGKVVTMDVDAAKQAYAGSMLEKAGLASFVEFRCGDAVDMVKADGGVFDFVLLDIWKELYLPCFNALYPKLAEEGIICSDNMVTPEDSRPSVRLYRDAVKAKVDLQSLLLPIGSGIELSVRWSADNHKL